MRRLFVGLEIPETLRNALYDVRGGVEGAHWQRDDQLHLTLAFIGDASRRTMHEIEGELSRIDVTPFELQLRGVGLFGKPKQPKTLWAGVADKAPLVHLHEKICHAMECVGVEVERRKYKPHVTLARFRRRQEARIGDWLTDNELLVTPSVTVDHFTLFSSQLTHEGSFYTVESRFGRGVADTTDEADFDLTRCFGRMSRMEPAW